MPRRRSSWPAPEEAAGAFVVAGALAIAVKFAWVSRSKGSSKAGLPLPGSASKASSPAGTDAGGALRPLNVQQRAALIATAWSIEQPVARKVVQIADRLGVRADWLANLIAFESRFEPAIVNRSSGATGLIQFMPTTALSLGTTTTMMSRMSALQQLDYVERYFESVKAGAMGNTPGGFPTKQSLFLAVFYPAFRFSDGKQTTFPQRVIEQNHGIRTPDDYVRFVDTFALRNGRWPAALASLGLRAA